LNKIFFPHSTGLFIPVRPPTKDECRYKYISDIWCCPDWGKQSIIASWGETFRDREETMKKAVIQPGQTMLQHSLPGKRRDLGFVKIPCLKPQKGIPGAPEPLQKMGRF